MSKNKTNETNLQTKYVVKRVAGLEGHGLEGQYVMQQNDYELKDHPPEQAKSIPQHFIAK